MSEVKRLPLWRAMSEMNGDTDIVKASDYDQLKEKMDYANQVIDQRHAMLDTLSKQLDEARELLEECSDMADACEDQVLLGHIDDWLEANKP